MRFTCALFILAVAVAAAAAENPIQVDVANKRIRIASKICKQNVYPELKGAIEYIAVCAGGKEYESVVTCLAGPQAICDALAKIDIRAGRPASNDGEQKQPKGAKLKLLVEWNDGKANAVNPLESFVYDTGMKKQMAPLEWIYTGSQEGKDPATGKPGLQVLASKNIISLHQKDPTVLVQNSDVMSNVDGRYTANVQVLPKEGTPVTLIIEAIPPKPLPPGSKRVRMLITGKVQGVGFREFTYRNARQLKLTGWVRNLPSGNEVEGVVEGKEEALKALEEKLRSGPRGAKVENFKIEDHADAEVFDEFEVRETPK